MIGDLLKFQGLFKKAERLYKEDEAKVMEYYETKDKDTDIKLTKDNMVAILSAEQADDLR